MTAHLSSDTLGDLLDDALAPASRRMAEDHLAQCAACAATLAKLRSLSAGAAALPRVMEPPIAVWNGVRDEIRGRTRMRRGPGSALAAWRSLGGSERGWLAAAGLLLAVLSAGGTAAALRSRGDTEAPAVAAVDRRAASPSVRPAAMSALEQDLAESVAALERSLEERRGTLLPRTVATVEHSLRVIDEAIAEARTALTNDPSNPALVDALSRGYERKIDLLKRASELAPRT